jgi:hypothetical protein
VLPSARVVQQPSRKQPAAIAERVVEAERVREAAAVAAPDELRGNVVKAFIVLAPDREPSDELGEEIKTFVRERLSAYAYPRRIEFVDDLPKTLTGKTRRIVLRQRELERVQAFAAKTGFTSCCRVHDCHSCRGAWLSPFGGTPTRSLHVADPT